MVHGSCFFYRLMLLLFVDTDTARSYFCFFVVVVRGQSFVSLLFFYYFACDLDGKTKQ